MSWLQRRFYQIGDLLFPRWIGKQIYYHWISVKNPKPVPKNSWIERAEPIKLADSRVVGYRIGEAPWALLVHGWAGNAAQFEELVGQLQQAGFGVLSFDAVGHGHSQGQATTLLEIVDSINELAERVDNITVLVGHSFGAVCGLYAIAEGVAIKNVVCVATPVRIKAFSDRHLTKLGVGPRAKHAYADLIYQRLDKDWWDNTSPLRNAGRIAQGGLVIQDKFDRIVPLKDGEALHAAWQNSELMVTENKGHNRILSDPEVLDRIVSWVTR